MDPNISWPLAHNLIRRKAESNTFGMVRHNPDGSKRPHQGWDFEAAVGTPCFAVADGTVAFINGTGDYGNLVAIAFPFGGRTLYAAYAHLSAVEVKLGQSVKKGERIGLTGDSGNAKGMQGEDLHLHFEIRTEPRPARGLAGRLSPLTIFGTVPLHEPIDV